MRTTLDSHSDTVEHAAPIACDSCKACCCALEVMLMADDDVARELVQLDRWGGEVMVRLAGGWCAALERETGLCAIYERRPTICRDFQVGGSECLAERLKLLA